MRITITLILALILALIVTIFAIQNNTPIDVMFLAWKIDGSLALILMITFALGILIGLLVSTPAWLRRVRQSSKLKRSIRGLEKDLEEARMASVKPPEDKPGEVPTAEMIDTDESGKEVLKDTNQGLEEENEMG